jgi:hypothetical protein
MKLIHYSIRSHFDYNDNDLDSRTLEGSTGRFSCMGMEDRMNGISLSSKKAIPNDSPSTNKEK